VVSFEDKDKLQVFENKELRKIAEHKRDKVTWQFRILHYEEFHDL